MKISAFTIVRDADRFDFQIEESIRSVLPIVDEFIVNVGKSNDNTLQLVKNIDSDKIRIIESVWDTSKYDRGGQIFAHQTNLMLKECKGDWCIYLQADEVLHEEAMPEIKYACKKYLNDILIDGFLLRYVHIYGDYKHYIPARHVAYPKEVRIVRNDKDIHSWRDAQSFRKIKNFDYQDYYRTKDTQMLRCILLDNAFIFHYGWSRDPYKMVKKIIVQKSLHDGIANINYKEQPYHDYGNISCFPEFKGSHPKVMDERIRNMNWQKVLSYSGANPNMNKIFPVKYRIINFIESFLPHGNRLWGFKNYKQKGIFKN
ncbi:MAG: hypothetical protein LBP67_03145 [Bacteroidales bacterium]|jgi:hypothetical protein|nr:hypothetical protein [Bacteroidales bacterium]